MKHFGLALLSAMILLFAQSCKGDKDTGDGDGQQASEKEYKWPFQDPSLSFEERVDDLVSRMSLEQKIMQLDFNAPALDTFGIPAYCWWNECLHGVARAGRATVFPQAVGMAAAWDEDLMLRIATCISDEGRAKHHEFARNGTRSIYAGISFWTPNINIFRDPRWGRGMETYGEDPYLTGRLSVNFCKGLQGDDDKYLKSIATPKHYAVHSGPEPLRHVFDAQTNEYDLWNTYFPAFKMSVEEANAWSVMCAYNRFRGEACCGSDYLTNEILREKWGFKGYVVSDCGAIQDIWADHKVVETQAEATALAVKSGTDLNCGNQYEEGLLKAVEEGYITEEEIDVAVKRMFLARMKLGLMDPPEMVDYAQIPMSVVESKKHQALALEATHKSIVLLKNENNTLPLNKAEIKTLAVIGPNADQLQILYGNYNGFSSNPVTPLKGLIDAAGKDIQVIYEPGCRVAPTIPVFETIPGSVLFTSAGEDKQPGLKATYYDNRECLSQSLKKTSNDRHYMLNPDVCLGKEVGSEIVENVNFTWWQGAPHKDLPIDSFHVQYTGVIIPEVSGTYNIGAKGYSGFRLVFEGDTHLAISHHDPYRRFGEYELEADKAYPITLDFFDIDKHAMIDLIWEYPGRTDANKAIEAAKQADAVVMCMGLSPYLEGEEMNVQVEGFKGGDRTSIKLPQAQANLIKKIEATGKPVVLVLLNGSALAINWEKENIPAIVEAWYPGQAGGTAIADILFGNVNPSGRLPVTFYKSVNDLPSFDEYNMTTQTYRYFKGEALFPFGYGLSYTTYSYGAPKLAATEIANDGSTELSVEISNTGQVDGEEVVQLYIVPPKGEGNPPIKELRGFKRQAVKAGGKETVSFTIDSKTLQFYCAADADYVVKPGEYTLMVGSSSADNDLQKLTLTVK